MENTTWMQKSDPWRSHTKKHFDRKQERGHTSPDNAGNGNYEGSNYQNYGQQHYGNDWYSTPTDQTEIYQLQKWQSSNYNQLSSTINNTKMKADTWQSSNYNNTHNPFVKDYNPFDTKENVTEEYGYTLHEPETNIASEVSTEAQVWANYYSDRVTNNSDLKERYNRQHQRKRIQPAFLHYES